MAIVDHTKNIETIILKIKSQDDLFDNGKTPGKLRAVNFGDPSNMTYQVEKKMPYCYVSVGNQTTSHSQGIANPENILPVSVEYKIVIVAHTPANTGKSQKILYDLVKNMRIMAEADPQFRTKGINPIFTRSVINDISWDEKTRGQLLTVITITLLASIGVFYYITIPGIGDPIPIISKPVSREYVSYVPHLSTSGQLSGYAATGESKTRYYEIEDSMDHRTVLNTIKNNKEKISYTINDEIIEGYLTAVNPSYNFDDQPLLTLQFEVL